MQRARSTHPSFVPAGAERMTPVGSAARTVCGASGVMALALVIACGAATARADGWGAPSASDRDGPSLLATMRACGPDFEAGWSPGSRCLARWSVDRVLLDTAARLATEQGQAVFGRHFRVVNRLGYAPGSGGLAGGLDVVLPLAAPGSLAAGSASPALDALFLQQGATRWVDDHGSVRNDFRIGAVRRFGLPGEGAASGVLGLSTFVQQNREFRHSRLVAGADYAGRWGRGSLSLFVPATGWRPAYSGYEERALAGVDLGLELDLTTTLSMNGAVGRWEDEGGAGGWTTNGRMSVGWRPHPWLDLGVAWNGLGTRGRAAAFTLAFSMPLGEARRAPGWSGLGLAGGGPEPSSVDAWRPVGNVDVIQVASRQSTGARLVAGATVRFLQESAPSGQEIGLEVRLPAATSRDLALVVTLEPGTGDHPAVPGVDYVDEPVAVTIAAGTSSAVVLIQLPLNSGLNEARSLGARVTLAS